MISSPIIILHLSTAVSNYKPVVLKYRIIRIRIIIKTFFTSMTSLFSNLGLIMITELKAKDCMKEVGLLIDQSAVRVK